MRIAIIGTGISGNVIANLLCKDHDVEVFEANDHVGGHSQTVPVGTGGKDVFADVGFMVFNDRTYPYFNQLLDRLGVASQSSDMSFSVQCARAKIEYQGSSLNGLFSQRVNALRPSFWKMLRDIARFNRKALETLEQQTLDERLSVGQFLDQHRLGKGFREHYLLPMRRRYGHRSQT